MNKRPEKAPSAGEVMALIQHAGQVGALADPGIQALAKAVAMNPEDRGLSMMFRERIAPYLVNSQINPDPLRPSPGRESGLSSGNIPIGIIHETGIPYNLPLADLTHTLVVGPTGAGKTNMTCWMLHGLYQKVPVVVITSKSEARMLVNPRIADVAVDIGELRIALFEPPPGLERKYWAYVVVDLFCREFGLQFSRVPFNQASDELVTSFADWSRQRGSACHPTLTNFFDLLCRSRSKYAESVRTAIDGFVRATGPVLDTARGMSMEQLLTRGATVINIASIREDNAARFIVSWLTTWLHEYWRYHGPNDGSVQTVLTLDDAHRFVAAQHDSGVTTITHTLQLTRQAGLRLVLVSQSPSELASNVLSQSGTVFLVGSLHYQRDLQAMGSVFGLAPGAYDRMLNNPRGHFIAIENLNRYQGAFGGCVDLFPSPAMPVSEAARRQAMQPILANLPFEPAIPTNQVMGGGTNAGRGAMPAKVPQMSQDALQLAINVIAYPFDFLSDHKARTGLIGGAW